MQFQPPDDVCCGIERAGPVRRSDGRTGDSPSPTPYRSMAVTLCTASPASAARILIVEDERKVRDALLEGFALEEWSPAAVETGAEALALLETSPFDLVVLDWMLPDLDGLEILQRARSRGIRIPVLMVTARGTVADRVTGIDLGADDYLVKPFAFAELVARCRALLRRSRRNDSMRLHYADLELDPHQRSASRRGEAIPLTPIELDVLEYLVRNQERVVTREMLRQDVWRETGDDHALNNAINIHIARLRNKIDGGDLPKLIHTLHGVGYRFGTR
jgi:DNA-binding response OmpR family regulator